MVAAKIMHRFEKRPSHIPEIGEAYLRDASLNSRDEAFVLHLVYGVVRFKEQLDYMLGRFADTRDFRKQTLKASILRLGAFQLMPDSKVSAPAAIDETVKLARTMLGEGMTGFVNAVLRKVAGASSRWYELLPDGGSAADLSARFSQPKWIIRLLIDDYGEQHAVDYLEAFSKRLRTTVRLNPTKSDRDDLERQLISHGIEINRSVVDEDYYLLPEGTDISSLTPISRGDCFVQNPSSGIVVSLISPERGWNILDLCAAPGGKTAAIVAHTGCPSDITALDSNASRSKLMQENFNRLGLDNVNVEIGDGAEYTQTGYDCVLVDAPCSGLGTISKHPEIKYIQTPENISELSKRQYALIDNAARLVNVNGVLVYSVCTITAAETVGICRRFLDNHEKFVLEVPPQFRYHHFVHDGMISIPPGDDNLEGMFAFRARKTA